MLGAAKRVLLGLVLTASLALPARAQSPATPGVSAPPALAAAPAAEAEPATKTDPHAGSAWASPTALTVPAGSLTWSLNELILLRATYGLTDRVQVSGGTTWAWLDGVPSWSLGIKAAIVSTGLLRVALLAEHFGLTNDQLYGATFIMIGGGPIASLCWDERCDTLISASVIAGYLDDDAHRNKVNALASANAVVALARHLKLAAEIYRGWSRPIDRSWATAVIRVSGARAALDLGLMVSLAHVTRNGIPVVSLSVRF